MISGQRLILGSTLGALFISGTVLLTIAARKNSGPLPVYGTLPEFALTDSTGAEFRSERLGGKVVIADFMFTDCRGICPMLTREMTRLQKMFAGNPSLELLSVSVDPENDSPAVLAAFAKENDIDTANWHLLTGDRSSVREFIIQGCKIGMPDEPLHHSDRFVLWDSQGRIRGYYSLSHPDSLKKLIRDTTRLLNQ